MRKIFEDFLDDTAETRHHADVTAILPDEDIYTDTRDDLSYRDWPILLKVNAYAKLSVRDTIEEMNDIFAERLYEVVSTSRCIKSYSKILKTFDNAMKAGCVNIAIQPVENITMKQALNFLARLHNAFYFSDFRYDNTLKFFIAWPDKWHYDIDFSLSHDNDSVIKMLRCPRESSP